MLDKKYIEITKSSHSLNFKNLKLYKIIDVIDNHHVYKLELSSSMFVIYSIFHSWLLHLDNSNSLIEQHRSSSSLVITLEFNHYDVIKIVKSRLNRHKKDLDSNSTWFENVKSCLQYKIHYENDEQWNQNLDWQNYIDIDDCSNLVVDFHHANLNEFESHWRFKSSQNWESLKNVINNVIINVEKSNCHIVATRIASSSSKSFLTNTL